MTMVMPIRTGNDSDLSSDPRGKRPLILRIGRKIRPWVNRIISRYSLIPTTPLIDPRAFAWTRGLERHADVIRDEAERILRYRGAIPPLDQISPDHARIASDGKWQSFFLYGYGFRHDENCARAPRTAAIVAQIPDLNSAFFSVLAPGAHIPRHKGVTQGLVTCHLGVIVPAKAERCRIQVGHQEAHWRQDRVLAFDDTYPHEVWNQTDELRCVLLIQVKRPVRRPGKWVADAFLGAVRRTGFVQDARRNLDRWEEAYRQAEMNEAA